MSDTAENAATRLWRDRAQLREQERNEAQAKARIAEEKVAILTAENDQLATEIARLRALLAPDAARARAETEQQMEALRTELLSLLDQPPESTLHWSFQSWWGLGRSERGAEAPPGARLPCCGCCTRRLQISWNRDPRPASRRRWADGWARSCCPSRSRHGARSRNSSWAGCWPAVGTSRRRSWP